MAESLDSRLSWLFCYDILNNERKLNRRVGFLQEEQPHFLFSVRPIFWALLGAGSACGSRGLPIPNFEKKF